MKGFNIDLVKGILVSIVALVIVLLIYTSVLEGQKDKSFLNMPQGMWLSVASADTKTFVLPPVIWFGEKLNNPNTMGSIDYGAVFKEGEPGEFIFPSNSVYIDSIIGLPSGQNFNYVKLLKSALFNPVLFPLSFFSSGNELIFKLNVQKSQLPIAAFYPLITDNFGSLKSGAPAKCISESGSDICHLDAKKPFGKVKVNFTIDFNKLHVEGHSFKREENFVNKNIRIGINYYTDADSKIKSCFGESDDGEKSKNMSELVSLGNCFKDEDSLNYVCSFELTTAEECCPSYVNIKPVVEINIAKEGEQSLYKTLDIRPISFMVVYYLDVLGDRDFVFDKFVSGPEGLQESLFFDDADSKHGPVRDLLIYPCRAKAKTPSSLARIKGAESEFIEWNKCESSTESYINLSSGWFCKHASAGNYYLYNPQAFCKLDGYELPSIPKPIYLEGIIPSKSVAKEWELPWILPDIKYGEYHESAWFWSEYMIARSIDILSPRGSNRNINFPENIPVSGVTVKFDFGEE